MTRRTAGKSRKRQATLLWQSAWFACGVFASSWPISLVQLSCGNGPRSRLTAEPWGLALLCLVFAVSSAAEFVLWCSLRNWRRATLLPRRLAIPLASGIACSVVFHGTLILAKLVLASWLDARNEAEFNLIGALLVILPSVIAAEVCVQVWRRLGQ